MYDDGSLRRRFDSLPVNFLHKPTRFYLTWGGGEALVSDARAFSRMFEERRFKDLRFQGGPVGHVGHAVSGVEAIAEGLEFGFARDAIPMSRARLEEYAGRYVSADGATTTRIKVANNGLAIDFSDSGAPADNVPLKVVGDDDLIAESNFVEIWFKRDAQSHVNGARMLIEGESSEMVRADRLSGRQWKPISNGKN
jgi:hypothetical protein